MSSRWIVAAGAGAVWILLSTILYAQAQPPPPPVTPQLSATDGLPILLGSVTAMIGAIAHAWINSNATTHKHRADMEKNRADQAEREMVDQFKFLSEKIKQVEVELRETQRERDRFVRWAYANGYRSDDNIPSLKAPQ